MIHIFYDDRLMIRYILSGFELELFSLHEYPYMYWYLYELLYPWLTTCLHRAESCLSGPATNSFFTVCFSQKNN